jgi:O-antigen/teichoic acid export membrane protein
MDKTVANLLYFFFAVLLVRLVGGITTFIIARILSPADYGIWVTLLVIASYAPILCLGTVEALVKMFPFYTGKGDLEKARRLESNVLGSLVFAAALLLAAGATFQFFTHAEAIRSLANIIRLVVLAAGFAVFSAFYYYRFTAHQNFRYVSFTDSLRAIGMFVLIVPFAWRWGLMGAALAFMVNEFLVLSWSYAANGRILGRVAIGFDFGAMRNLVAIGFPITVIWWVYMLQMSADRLISMSMLGKEATGFYGLGASMVSAIVLIPMVLGRVLYPKVNEEVGKNTNRDGLNQYVLVPAQGLGLVVPFLIGTLIILTPELYRIFFPKYIRGIASAQILLVGVYFICLIRTGVNYLVAINKQNKVLGFVMMSLCLNIAASVALVKLGLSIEGISIGTAVSGLVLAVLIWKSVFVNLAYARHKQYRELGYLIVPFLICAILSVGLLAICRGAAPRYYPLSLYGAAVLFVALYSVAVFTIPPLNSWSKNLYTRIREQGAGMFSKRTSAVS